jgi:hypothetical protein
MKEKKSRSNGARALTEDRFQYWVTRPPANRKPTIRTGYRSENKVVELYVQSKAADSANHQDKSGGPVDARIVSQPGDNEQTEWLCYPRSSAGDFIPVNVLASPSIAREFAAITDNDQAIGFMGRYGWLGHGERIRPIAETGQPDGRTMFIADRLSLWITEARRLRLLMEMWDGRHCQPNVEEYLRLTTPKFLSLRHWPVSNEPRRVAYAREFVEQEVNTMLKRHTGACVGFEIKRLFTMPCCLLGALYVSFAFEMTGHIVMAICAGCGKDFPQTRSNKQTCGASCRQRWKRNPKNPNYSAPKKNSMRRSPNRIKHGRAA